MAIKLLIPGRGEPAAPHAASVRSVGGGAAPGADIGVLDGVQVMRAFSLSPAARSAKSGQPESFEAEDDDILEIEVEGGFTLWTSAARYQEQVAFLKPEAIDARGLSLDVIAQPSASERGVKEWVISALRVLRLKPDQILKDATDPAKWPGLFKDLLKGRGVALGSWVGTKLLMHSIESHLTPGPGLYRWAAGENDGPADLGRTSPLAAGELLQGKPLLVFIHGTASSTTGSFGALAAADARLHWRTLRERFGEHIYAFEHRTLSESPIENAVALLEVLPDEAQVHLVTHSRGGLVGDLLCLSEISDGQLERYRRRDEEQREADAYDQKQLRRLRELLQRKRVRVLRYARVACPARGTLLASDNIDEFLSLLTNLIGLIPGLAGSPVYQVIKRVTLEVVRQRLRASMIPGVEAMIPESPLVALLNGARNAAGSLGVIAGDIEGGSWLQQLGVFVTDRFLYERHDNDLVVNTDSMFLGARHVNAGYVFDQGGTVSHFNYFRNETTRSALVRWVTAADQSLPAEFKHLDVEREAPLPTLRSMQKRAGVAQPVVFVLPGIMGSQLERDGNRIWLDYLDLAVGGIARLRDLNDARIEPAGVMGDYYRALCEYLSNSHEVIPFAYDWRKSIRNAGAELGKAVEKTLAASGQPIRFVAHSMGGMVTRAFIADHPQLWERVCARPGSRLLMLGTPNRGSHSMVETLLGMVGTIRQLALLDIVHSRQKILEIVADFSGALELLPQPAEGERDWFSRAVWVDLHRANRDEGGRPTEGLLVAAKKVVAGLPEAIPHAERVLYVAGRAPSTPCGLEVDAHGRLSLLSTDAGDGRVTYAAGRLPGVAIWYTDVEHGDLPKYEPAFPCYLELLNDGRTNGLATKPPSSVRGLRGKTPYQPQSVLYPSEPELVAGLLGSRMRRYETKKAAGVRVSVVHGDLRHARFPLMAGHYAGDTIAGVERFLDGRVGGALSQRYGLGIYPGPLGTSAVVLRERDRLQKALDIPRGAVIIGLGAMGELTPATLADAVRRGVLEYVAVLEDREDEAAAGGAPRRVGLSVLLIGTNSASNITVEDSVTALLRGIGQANLEVEKAQRSGASSGHLATQVSEVEIMELFSDLAIQAAHAVRDLAPRIEAELGLRVEAADLLREGRGGRDRVTAGAAPGYWRRWIVTAEDRNISSSAHDAWPAPLLERMRATLSDPEQVDQPSWNAVLELAFPEAERRPRAARALRYIALTDRARAEVRVQQGQPELIERLVRISVRDTQFKVEAARTLFELMIPNELKDTLLQQSRLVMVVDAETSTFPWELMADGARPVCVEVGFVRQLQTADFRRQIRASTVSAVYVVGDPLTDEGVPHLPAARAEAEQVASLLGDRFQVTCLSDRPSAMEVLNGLFARPYRIVHLAGHGYFERGAESDARARSGMVLEGGIYLTAAEIGQMRQVPDLVFLNCCHLGQVGAEARGAVTPEYNRLAASISRELIEMGVRAVVAAGWAVRDDAASFFARIFYEDMLAGAAFGDALLRGAAPDVGALPRLQHLGRVSSVRRSCLPARRRGGPRRPVQAGVGRRAGADRGAGR